MQSPNFFIIGAPKCGTSAMAHYLSTHPNVFFSTPKEPHYFATDFPSHQGIKDLKSYLNLFKDADENIQRIGEGSVLYLYSKEALKNIYEFCPQAKIIVMLRNPVDMVYSLHQQYLHALYEDEPDFEKAWLLQEHRANGIKIPRLCRQSELLQYGELAKFGKQLQHLYSLFSKEQVMVIRFEDFCNNTAKIYEQVLDFLSLIHDGRTQFERVNDSQILRAGLFKLIAKNSPVLIRDLVRKLRYTKKLSFIPKLLDALFKSRKTKTLMNVKTRLYLEDFYADDQQLLFDILNNK